MHNSSNVSQTNREIPYHRAPLHSQANRVSSVGREQMIEEIKSNWPEIVQSVKNVAVSASDTLAVLQGLGHLKHVTKSNGVGDVLGEKGLKLPHAIWKQKRLYLLPAIEWDDPMREAFHGLSNEEQMEKIQALELDLLGFDSERFETPEMKAEKEAICFKEAQQSVAEANAKSDAEANEAEAEEVLYSAKDDEEVGAA
ncbi:MAG: hypothetical protein V4819_24050 [Verrucomicrobiota bacterium]